MAEICLTKDHFEEEGFYKVIGEADFNSRNLVLTVLDGDKAGSKALVSDHRMVWESQEGFFAAWREEVEGLDVGGMISVGGQRVFCEFLCRDKKLVICGGGHISLALIRMGQIVGFPVTVLEDRNQFAEYARRAGASRVIFEPFEKGIAQVEGDEDTYFVIATRGHRHDQMCLSSIVEKKHAYIGMVGSRARAALVKKSVIEEGGDADVVGRVYSPIGLGIGAETPEEIAVAIMAEIIEVKNRRQQGVGYPKELLEAILAPEKGRKILATIVSRRGSAPRAVGTKMLVMQDSRCVGTIGGGCAEAEVIRRALVMLEEGRCRPEVICADMSGKYAEEEGMVCGGAIEVFLERV